MLFQTPLIFLFLINPTSVIATPTPDENSNITEVESPITIQGIGDQTIWLGIREIAESSSPNKDATLAKLIKGTFLDPEVITATESSSSNPTAQNAQCDTSSASPRYADSLFLLSIVYGRQEFINGRVYNPGRKCTEFINWNTSHFSVCSWEPSYMTWRTLGNFAYAVTTSCPQFHGDWVSCGGYVWDTTNPRFPSDVRVY